MYNMTSVRAAGTSRHFYKPIPISKTELIHSDFLDKQVFFCCGLTGTPDQVDVWTEITPGSTSSPPVLCWEIRPDTHRRDSSSARSSAPTQTRNNRIQTVSIFSPYTFRKLKITQISLDLGGNVVFRGGCFGNLNALSTVVTHWALDLCFTTARNKRFA